MERVVLARAALKSGEELEVTKAEGLVVSQNQQFLIGVVDWRNGCNQEPSSGNDGGRTCVYCQ